MTGVGRNPASPPVTGIAADRAAARIPSSSHRDREQGPLRRRRPWWLPANAHAYLLVLPCVVVIGVLVVYPLVVSVVDSVRSDNAIVATHQFVGARNYTTVLTDPSFQRASVNTLVYLAIATLGSLVVGWGIASWLHSIRRMRAVFLAIIVLPWAVPGTVNGVLWSFILNPTNGLLNRILRDLHLISHNIVWLAGTQTGLIAIGISLVWQIAPISAVILLAGLENIPRQLYEQAAVDGASPRHTFLRITTPLLRPALAIALLQAGILGISIFDQVYVLSSFSPNTSSVLLQVYLYAFQDFNFGVGMAASMIVTVATLLLSLFYLKVIYREIEM